MSHGATLRVPDRCVIPTYKRVSMYNLSARSTRSGFPGVSRASVLCEDRKGRYNTRNTFSLHVLFLLL